MSSTRRRLFVPSRRAELEVETLDREQEVRMRLRRFLMTGGLLLSFVGCSSDEASEGTEGSLEIFSWLTAPGEREALEVLFDQLKETYPDLLVTNAAASDPTNARDRLQARMREGEPPDSFQAVGGKDLMLWIDQGKMSRIDALVEKNGWTDVFPAPLLDLMRKGDHYYGVPLNIERDNNLYYGIELLEEKGLEPPRTLEDFYAACERLQEEEGGARVVPLALPAAGWVLALVAFETLMPTVTGGEFYLDFFSGRADPSAPELREFFEEFARVVDCSNVATAEPSWGVAADMLVDKKAAFYVMGDWAKGYLEKDEDASGGRRTAWTVDDFGVVPGLGSEGYFTFNSIVFGIPTGAVHPKAASAFLEVVASRRGQVASNSLKGSIPARSDVSSDEFDAINRQVIDDFQAAAAAANKLLPGYASLTSFEFQQEMNPSLLVFAVGGERARELDASNVPESEAAVPAKSIEYIINKIAANYDLLR